MVINIHLLPFRWFEKMVINDIVIMEKNENVIDGNKWKGKWY